jgi:glycosyltransferase involved in cell wall biosynthesis
MTRDLLLVTYHFPPSAASGTFRLLGFARHLPRHDWRVHVVAPPSMPWDPTDPALAAQVPADTDYHAVPYPYGAPRPLRLAAPYGLWLPPAWLACRRVIGRQRPDLVLTSGPPHVVHLLGLVLQRAERLPWVADFRDPWISGMSRPPLTLGKRWLRYWEKQVLRRADRVLANAPNAGRMFRATYPREAGKVITLTNGFDPPTRPVPPRPRTGALRMLHAGEIYAGRDPLPLLDAIAGMKNEPPVSGLTVRLDVLGNVHMPAPGLATEAERRGLAAEVAVRGQLPYQEALQEMAESDLLVLLDAPGRTIGVPAKLYEYFGAGRPILALTEPDSDTAEVLRASGVQHRIAPPTDVGRIRQALAELAQESATAADPERLRRFTREHLTGELAAIMDRIVAERGGAPAVQACLA